MLYSNPCEYAIRALTSLALQPGDPWVSTTAIAAHAEVPEAFLGKILKDLVKAGMLRSMRGPGGGYRLTGDAADIRLLDVKAAIDGLADLDRCAVGLDPCADDTPCPLHEEFKHVRRTIRDYLSSTTIEDLAVGVREKRALLTARGSLGGRRAPG